MRVFNMKVMDLDIADMIYNVENEIKNPHAKMRFPQKYIILDTGECYDLQVEEVTDTAIYVKIADYERFP